jgi:hypothetical protein
VSELRKVPVWAWVLLVLAVLYGVTVRVGASTGASGSGQVPVQAGGPPAPYALPDGYTHSCPVSWDGRWSWSPNKVGEWLYGC